MTDVHSKQVRSYNMSMIRSKNTKPEMIVRRYLFSSGFRYRVNVQGIKGKPDIVFTKYRIVIFINGCFGTDILIVKFLFYLRQIPNGGKVK